MEPCVRGFSYMPETKAEVMDLQYIEGGELERTWKASRRQRLKEQEEKIWEEFVKEQDIVKMACTEDPYQFLHQLPENCLKEMMEAELQKMRKETQENVIVELPNQGEGDHPSEKQVLHTVTFADDEQTDCIFHIFDDENDLNDEESGPEEEAAVESPGSGPSTVRERREDSPSENNGVGSIKSSENVTNLIESTINCARVKDLRIKINDEMLAIMVSLDSQDVMSVERSDVSRKCRRSIEFCARFNRIYMYQLQRQVHDIKRAQAASLPFALHTHYQAQMSRVLSLHQNVLQALQIFHKSLEQTACLRESAAMLHTLLQFIRDISTLCCSLPAPKDFTAAHDLYNDELSVTCDKLDEAVNEYSGRVAEFIFAADNATNDNTSSAPSKKSKSQSRPTKKERSSQGFKCASKSWSTKDTDARLSMYSLDTLRLNLTATSSLSKHNNSRTPCSGPKSKTRVPDSGAGNKLARNKSPKSHRTSPRSRRPLMRAPSSGQARPKIQRDSDIATMVQAVDACSTSHVSRDVSPRTPHTPRAAPTPRVSRPHGTPRTSENTTPRHSSRVTNLKPKTKLLPDNVTHEPAQNNKILNSGRTETRNSPTNKIPNVLPVTQIQCAKKNFEIDKLTNRNIAKEAKDTRHAGSPKERSKYLNETAEKSIPSINTNKNRYNDKIGCYQEIASNSKDSRGNHGDVVSPDREDDPSENCNSVKERTDGNIDTDLRSTKKKNDERDGEKSDRDRTRASSSAPARCDVTRLLHQLCSGDGSGSRNERVTGAKNAQLFCMIGSPSRQPSTPQLLRILEETIQKKAPKPMYQKGVKDPDRYRLQLKVPETSADRLFQYRSQFVQHMLTSSMYANCALEKPWEAIGSVSEKIIDELLMSCAREMEIKNVLQELYNCETN